MQNSRLFEILYLLVEKRALTAGELAHRFEVSTRTIYRDIDALSAAGIPVYTQKGQGGGIRLLDQFVLDRCLLTPKEQDEVLFALRSLLSTGAADDGRTLGRLSALFRRDGSDWVEVDFADWGSGREERQAFQLIKSAILGRHPLGFTYYSSAGVRSRRQVEPAKLVFKGGCWYLQGWCLDRRDWRTFRLSRMEGLTPGKGTCPPRPAPPRQLDEALPPDCRVARLRLRFAPGAAYRVRDYFHPQRVTQQPDGSLLVECAMPEDNWLLGFLLSFGDQVEVLSPGYWRDILAREAKKVARLYEIGHAVSDLMGYPESIQGGTNPPSLKEDIFMSKERVFCQSCGMPLDAPEDRGTNADGTLSQEYCRYCWKDGAFTAPEATMEDMIQFNLKYNAENGHPFGPQEQAERQMRAWFPTLKRWKGV